MVPSSHARYTKWCRITQLAGQDIANSVVSIWINLGGKCIHGDAWVNNGKAQEQTAKLISLEKIKILILLELAQQIYSCHCKNPPKSCKCLTLCIFGPCDINFSNPIKRNQRRQSVGLTPVSLKHHSPVLLFIPHGCAGRQRHCFWYICCKRRCLATATNAGFPLHHFPEDWNTAPRSYLRAPSVWLTTYACSFFSWLEKKILN